MIIRIVLIAFLLTGQAYAYDRADYGQFTQGLREVIAQRQAIPMAQCYYSLVPVPVGALQLDHIVPIAYTDKHGGSSWPENIKRQFMNDPENLVLVLPNINASKGDKPPSQWLPAHHQSEYLAAWRKICGKYGINCEDIK